MSKMIDDIVMGTDLFDYYCCRGNFIYLSII